MKTSRITLVALVAVIGFAATAVRADILVEADADAHIEKSSPDANFGGGVTLKVRGGFSPFSTYLRFDTSGILAGETITAATLVLTSSETTGLWEAAHTFTVYGLIDGNAGEAWIEGNGGGTNVPVVGEITWNNAPANDVDNAGFTADATNLGSFTIADTSGTVMEFTSSALKDFLEADTNGTVTIMVAVSSSTNGNDIQTLYSSERFNSALRPRLEVTTIPEPGAMGLVVAGGLAMLPRSRRRP